MSNFKSRKDSKKRELVFTKIWLGFYGSFIFQLFQRRSQDFCEGEVYELVCYQFLHPYSNE